MRLSRFAAALTLLLPITGWAQHKDEDLFSPAVQQADAAIRQGHVKEGMEILRSAAATGEASAEYALAHYLTKDKDQPEVLRLMTAAATQGYPLAILELGWQYEMGGGTVPRHPRLARDYYAAVEAKGAPSGHRGAMRANAGLGSWASFVPGTDETQADQKLVAQDYAAAAPLYKRAAEAGSASAAYEYAILCDLGLGVAKSDEESKRWMLTSAKQGYPPAELELGRSKLVPDAEKLTWLTKASDAGSPHAEYWLAQSKFQGRDGTPKDDSGGWALVRKAVDQQETFAKLMLASAYMHGNAPGIAKDQEKAFVLTVEAAEDGNPIAAEFLAVVTPKRPK